MKTQLLGYKAVCQTTWHQSAVLNFHNKHRWPMWLCWDRTQWVCLKGWAELTRSFSPVCCKKVQWAKVTQDTWRHMWLVQGPLPRYFYFLWTKFTLTGLQMFILWFGFPTRMVNLVRQCFWDTLSTTHQIAMTSNLTAFKIEKQVVLAENMYMYLLLFLYFL